MIHLITLCNDVLLKLCYQIFIDKNNHNVLNIPNNKINTMKITNTCDDYKDIADKNVNKNNSNDNNNINKDDNDADNEHDDDD